MARRYARDRGKATSGYARARTLGIEAGTDFYSPGTHTWPYGRRELPTLLG
jgi:S-formylglutathione hydrolase FrmB